MGRQVRETEDPCTSSLERGGTTLSIPAQYVCIQCLPPNTILWTIPIRAGETNRPGVIRPESSA